MDGHEGRWGAVRGALQFAIHIQRHISGLESASCVMNGICGTFDFMLHKLDEIFDLTAGVYFHFL